MLQTQTREVSDGGGWVAGRETALLRVLMAVPGRAIGRPELLK